MRFSRRANNFEPRCRLLKGIIEFLAKSCLFVKDVAWTCKNDDPGWRWNFESMKKAIKTEIMNSFCAVCHVAVCLCCLLSAVCRLRAWAGPAALRLERTYSTLLGCHWVKGSVMESTSVAGSCLGWLAWGVTVFNCSHIWRRAAICQKRALLSCHQKVEKLLPRKSMGGYGVTGESQTKFFNNNHKSCCTNVFHFVARWLVREKIEGLFVLVSCWKFL